MKKQYLLAIFFAALPFFAIAREKPISEDELIRVINSAYGTTPLYESKDIPNEELHSQDFNGDGKDEWVVVPKNACGETKNCTFFILQHQGSKGWKLLLTADGRVTPTTPFGFAIAPHHTKGYSDLVAMFDTGHDPSGARALDRRVFIWNGEKYEETTDKKYPPSDANEELKNFLKKMDQLRFSRLKPANKSKTP